MKPTVKPELKMSLPRLLIALGAGLLTGTASLAAELGSSGSEKVATPSDFSAELPRIAPLEPTEALQSFQLIEGFDIELAAAEPEIVDPVAMAFDEDGRLFVVEMSGYSEQADENRGRIRVLEDVDEDGRFEQSRVFASGLSWPTAITCYDGGVFVGVPPNIIYLRDNDGDGLADQHETVYTGFGKSNVQGLLNSFEWGLDNRIHGATSSSGGEVVHANRPNATPLSLKGRDFSFDPRTRELRATSGGGQHGLTFNRWGDKFVCHNSSHMQMIVAEDRYLARNPYQAVGEAKRSIAADGPQAEVFRASPVEPWRIVRTRLRAQGIVRGILEGGGRASGYFTSATGITSYEGDAWPDKNRGLLFVADVGSNLVHRKRLRPRGASYIAERIDPGHEFLTSRDVWFRPVQFCNGPDGNMYFADMYREVIEHPRSLPKSIKQHLDLTSGRDRGRLYRIVAEDSEQRKIPRLSEATSLKLVAMLDHRNVWHRRSAARLLYERQEKSVAPALRKLAANADLPEGRIAALYALDGLGELRVEELLTALSATEHAEVQRSAVQLSEPLANHSQDLREALYRLIATSPPRVLGQLAFSLGELSDGGRFAALAEIASRGLEHEEVLDAVASSLNQGAGQVLKALQVNNDFFLQPTGRRFLAALIRQIAKQQSNVDLRAVSELMAEKSRGETGQGQLVFLLNQLRVARDSELLAKILDMAESVDSNTIEELLDYSRTTALDHSQPEWKRAEAIGLLRWLPWDELQPVATQILHPSEPPDLQAAVISTLTQSDSEGVAPFLLGHWPTLSTDLRNQVATALYSRADWSSQLLDLIEARQASGAEFGASGLALLASHPDEQISTRAKKLQGSGPKKSHAEILEPYLPALQMVGEASRGKQTFRKLCSTCHQHHGIGHAIGPNLATAQRLGGEAVLLNILAPNAEVNPQYVSYVVVTDDGLAHAGMLTAETSTTITLHRGGDQTETVLRSEIEEMHSTGLSLMPEGMSREIDVAAMADLLAFLRSVQ